MPDEKLVKVEVLQAEGMLINGYGTRAKGEFFDLPESVASELIARLPESLKLATEPRPLEYREKPGRGMQYPSAPLEQPVKDSDNG